MSQIELHCRFTCLSEGWIVSSPAVCQHTVATWSQKRPVGTSAHRDRHSHTHVETYSVSCEIGHLSAGVFVCLYSFHTFHMSCWVKEAIFKMSLDLSSQTILYSPKACWSECKLEQEIQRLREGGDDGLFTISFYCFYLSKWLAVMAPEPSGSW